MISLNARTCYRQHTAHGQRFMAAKCEGLPTQPLEYPPPYTIPYAYMYVCDRT